MLILLSPSLYTKQEPCTDILPPATIQSALPYLKNDLHYKHVNKFSHMMTFSTTRTGPFSLNLRYDNLSKQANFILAVTDSSFLLSIYRYDFVSSGLSFLLQGSVFIDEGSVVNKTYYGQIGNNHAFLHEVERIPCIHSCGLFG